MNDIMQIWLIGIGSPDYYSRWNILSCEALAGDLRGVFESKIEIKVFRVDTYEDIKRVFNIDSNVAIIGFSPSLGSLSIMDKLWKNLNSICRSKGFSPIFLIGNKLPTYCPDYCVKRYPGAIIIQGEAELTMRALVDMLLHEKTLNLNSLPNVCYTASDGSIRYTWRQHCSNIMLNYPPSRDTTIEVINRGDNVLVQASRGCHWSKCIYCTSKSFRCGKGWESMPIKRIAADIEELISMGAKELEFADDEFMGGREPDNLRRALEISKLIFNISRDYKTKVSFRIFLEPSIVFREHDPEGNKCVAEVIQSLCQAGMTAVYIGVESGCDSQLQRYRRPATLDETVNALQILKSFRLHVDTGFIMFDPWVTRMEIRDNIRFYRKNDLVKGNQWPFRPLVINEGTVVKEKAKNEGILGDQVPNFISYSYRFVNPHVALVYQIIDRISIPSRNIFYALKTLSKSRFNVNNHCNHHRLAQEIIRDNALIYLDLMAILVSTDNRQTWKIHLEKAIDRVDNLMNLVSKEFESGKFVELSETLSVFLSQYKKDDMKAAFAALEVQRSESGGISCP